MSLSYRDENGVEQGIAGTPYDVMKRDGEAIDAILNVYGSKNLIPYPYVDTDNNTPSATGITFTTNADGSITAVGTSITRAYRKVARITLQPGTYIISGVPEGASDTTWRIHTYNTVIGNFYDGDTKVTLNSESTFDFFVDIPVAGVDVSKPITFYPMIRDARIADNSYQPASKTNRQLTKEMLMMKPNLWKVGVEYDFGDGVYGQRFKGVKTGNQLAGANDLVTGVAKTAQVLNSGGMVDMSGTAGTNWYNVNGVWDSGGGGVYRPLFTNSNQKLQFYCKNNQGITTGNIQYDIWMIYTKV